MALRRTISRFSAIALIPALIVVGFAVWEARDDPAEAPQVPHLAGSTKRVSSPAGNVVVVASSATTDTPGSVVQTADIEFLEGEFVSITIRRRIPVGPPIASLAAQFDDFARSAKNGDGEAGYLLWQALTSCKDVVQDESILQAKIELMYQTRSKPTGSGEPIQFTDDDSVAMYEETLRREFEMCIGVTPEQTDRAEDWLHIAADNGHISSMHTYAMRNKSTLIGHQYLERGWQAGDIVATSWLYRNFKEGFEGLQPDPVKAYAYLYLYSQLAKRQFNSAGEMPGPIRQRMLQAIQIQLEEETKLLRPSDLTDALAYGMVELENNRDCCI